ncbi:MAG: ATP-binding protein [Desulfurococcales archaeon]|nr:ATP-binding protein [Desulfurococcales archaeon]
MGLFDISIGILAIITIILMFRNLNESGLQGLRPLKKCGSEEVILQGVRLEPTIYIAQLPRGDPDPTLGARLTTLIRQSGLNVTLAFTLVKADKSKLIKRLEKEIEKVSLAYEATKSKKYGEKLKTLEALYSDVLRSTRPYTGATTLIIWHPPRHPGAEALKTLIEAETGLVFKRVSSSIIDALLKPLTVTGSSHIEIAVPWLEETGDNSVVLGVNPEYNSLVTLKWPEDFETHIGVFGPTGKGKTVLMAGIMLQLSMLQEETGEPNIIVIDPKGDLAAYASRIPHSSIEIHQPRVEIRELCTRPAIHIIENPDIEAGRRLISDLLECYYKDKPRRRTVIFIDEAWKFIDVAEHYLEESIRQGRSLGLHIVYATQAFSDVNSNIVENTGTLIVFGSDSESYTEKADRLGVPSQMVRYLPVGSAVVRKRSSIPVRLKAFNFAEYLK